MLRRRRDSVFGREILFRNGRSLIPFEKATKRELIAMSAAFVCKSLVANLLTEWMFSSSARWLICACERVSLAQIFIHFTCRLLDDGEVLRDTEK